MSAEDGSGYFVVAVPVASACRRVHDTFVTGFNASVIPDHDRLSQRLCYLHPVFLPAEFPHSSRTVSR